MPTIKKPKKAPKKGAPVKIRIVRSQPRARQFSPRGNIGRPGYRELKFEEFEAIRLADHMEVNQTEAADLMGISQQTFSRVLRMGRKCIAEALVKGEIIKVQGGEFKIESQA